MTVLSSNYDFGDRRNQKSKPKEMITVFPEDGIWKVSTKNGKRVITKITEKELVIIAKDNL